MVSHTTPGLFSSFQSVLKTGVEAAHTRLELLAVEVREERGRLMEALFLASAALFLAIMAVIVLTATIVLLSPPEARPWVAGGITLVYLGGAAWAAIALKAKLSKHGMPLAETIAQLKKDAQCLDSRS